MLIYHPAEDSNHCAYRIIRLLSKISTGTIPQATLMICDFYSLFPGHLKNISGWPRANSKSWKTIHGIPDEYEDVLNVRRIFFRLKDIQLAAISYLCAKEVISVSSSIDKQVGLNERAVPEHIWETLDHDEYYKSNWFSLLATDLAKMNLYGKSGLKSKSGLMEFLYD